MVRPIITGRLLLLERRDLRLLAAAWALVLVGLAGFVAAVERAIPDDRVFTGCLFNNVDGWNYRAYDRYLATQFLFGPEAAAGDWISFLTTYPVEYVRWSRDEDRHGGARPADAAFLERIFDNGEVAVYRVVRPG